LSVHDRSVLVGRHKEHPISKITSSTEQTISSYVDGSLAPGR